MTTETSKGFRFGLGILTPIVTVLLGLTFTSAERFMVPLLVVDAVLLVLMLLIILVELGPQERISIWRKRRAVEKQLQRALDNDPGLANRFADFVLDMDDVFHGEYGMTNIMRMASGDFGSKFRILYRRLEKEELVMDAGWSQFMLDAEKLKTRKRRKAREFKNLIYGKNRLNWIRKRVHKYVKDFYWFAGQIESDGNIRNDRNLLGKHDRFRNFATKSIGNYDSLVSEWNRLHEHLRRVLGEDFHEPFKSTVSLRGDESL